MNLKLNFSNTYKLSHISADRKNAEFGSPQKNGTIVQVHVRLSTLNLRGYTTVIQNLGFGPLKANGTIDDTVRLKHSDPAMVYSTILLIAFAYLQLNKSEYIGIDGSNDSRAKLYHSIFRSNKTYLSGVSIAAGVDYFSRLYRDKSVETDSNGMIVFSPMIRRFDYTRQVTKELYHYYLFRRK